MKLPAGCVDCFIQLTNLIQNDTQTNSRFAAVAGNNSTAYIKKTLPEAETKCGLLHLIENFLTYALTIHDIQSIFFYIIAFADIFDIALTYFDHRTAILFGCQQMAGSVRLDEWFYFQQAGCNVGCVGYAAARAQKFKGVRNEGTLNLRSDCSEFSVIFSLPPLACSR